VDLVCAYSFANMLSVFTNNGSGGFVLACSTGVGAHPTSSTAADFNGDGWMDLASANNGAGTLTVLFNVPILTIQRSSNTMSVSWQSLLDELDIAAEFRCCDNELVKQ